MINTVKSYAEARDRLYDAQQEYEDTCQRIAEGLAAREVELSPLVVTFDAEEWNAHDEAVDNPHNSGEWPLSLVDAADLLDRSPDDLAALSEEEWEDVAEEMTANRGDYDGIRDTETSPVPAKCLMHTGPFTVSFYFAG